MMEFALPNLLIDMAKSQITTCLICKKEFKAFYSALFSKRKRFCSIACKAEAQILGILKCKKKKGESKPCINCDKEVYRAPKWSENVNVFACSRRCWNEYQKNQSLQKTSIRNNARHEKHRKSMAREVAFNSKPAICECCGYSEYKFCLDVHHKDMNRWNNSPDNLAILCAICHRKLHHHIISNSDIKPIIDILKEAESIIK
jgi:hypothetical protein